MPSRKASPLGVFISYPSEDDIIANALLEAFKELDKTRISVFKDTLSIPMGGIIGNYLKGGLQKSKWFLAVGTDSQRQNFDWCGLELGHFMNKVNEKNSHLFPVVCLYDKTVPELFQGRKQVRVFALRNEQLDDLPGPVHEIHSAPLYELMLEFAEYYKDAFKNTSAGAPEPNYESWAETHTVNITDNYWKAVRMRVRKTWLPQKKILITAEPNKNSVKLTGNICLNTLMIDAATLPIFDMGITNDGKSQKMDWPYFVENITSKTGAGTIAEAISEVILSILPDKDKARNDLVIKSPTGPYYRVILSKHSLYGNGKREFEVIFIETLDRTGGGDPRTTVLKRWHHACLQVPLPFFRRRVAIFGRHPCREKSQRLAESNQENAS